MDKVERAVIELDGVWPCETMKEGCAIETLEPNVFAVSRTGPYSKYICTYEEFMETRKRLENKPSWDSHNYTQIIQAPSGAWQGSYHKERWHPCEKDWHGWEAFFVDDRNQQVGRVFGDWRQSLERRPEDPAVVFNSAWVDGAIVDMGKSKDEWPEPQWVPGETLPPVGTTQDDCELVGFAGDYSEWEVIALRQSCAILYVSDPDGDEGEVFTALAAHFAPLRTHRDKVIEAVAGGLGNLCPLPEVLNAIYDIGALKLPEGE